MSSALTQIEDTTRRFRNISELSVHEVTIPSTRIRSALQDTSRIFRGIDHADPYHKELSNELWRFRAKLVFTLLPFDNRELELAAQIDHIVEKASSIPAVRNDATALGNTIARLLANPDNPKLQWIRDNVNDSDPTGLLMVMAMGKTFGLDGTFERGIEPIETPKDLKNCIFDNLVIPGTSRFLSPVLRSQVFELGRFKSVTALLYPGERLVMGTRLIPPTSPLFADRLSASRVSVSRELGDGVREDDDVTIEDHAFEDSPTPGVINDSAEAGHLKKSWYISFANFDEMFVPYGSQVLVWREDERNDGDNPESVGMRSLTEGDLVIASQSTSGDLLDIEAAVTGFNGQLDQTCEWRDGLERLLLTMNTTDVGNALREQGVRAPALEQSVQNWADSTTYGPGNASLLRALIKLLADQQLLPGQDDLDRFAEQQWQKLQQLRTMRQRAGARVRETIFRQLAEALRQGDPVADARSVELENGIIIELRRVAGVSSEPSWVEPSRVRHGTHNEVISWPG